VGRKFLPLTINIGVAAAAVVLTGSSDEITGASPPAGPGAEAEQLN